MNSIFAAITECEREVPSKGNLQSQFAKKALFFFSALPVPKVPPVLGLCNFIPLHKMRSIAIFITFSTESLIIFSILSIISNEILKREKTKRKNINRGSLGIGNSSQSKVKQHIHLRLMSFITNY